MKPTLLAQDRKKLKIKITEQNEEKKRAEVSEGLALLASAHLSKGLSGSGRMSEGGAAQNRSQLFLGLLLPPTGELADVFNWNLISDKI